MSRLKISSETAWRLAVVALLAWIAIELHGPLDFLYDMRPRFLMKTEEGPSPARVAPASEPESYYMQRLREQKEATYGR